MNVQQRVPPTGRDFEVYRLVTVGQMSTREVAEGLRISQTRVCQLVARVGAFVAEVFPAAEEPDKEREIRVAEQIAAERVQFLYGLAVRSFERSAGEQRTTRQATSGITSGTIVTSRMTAGDTRYLNCAGRLAILATKLPPPRMMEWMAGDEDDEETTAGPANPQKEACSAAPPEQGLAATTTTPAGDATLSGTETSTPSPVASWNTLRDSEPTVHLPKSQVEQKLATGRPLTQDDRKGAETAAGEETQAANGGVRR